VCCLLSAKPVKITELSDIERKRKDVDVFFGFVHRYM
jgi:hypothetical protein